VADVDSMPFPGPDPIVLVADQGFIAEIELGWWLLVDAPVTERRMPSRVRGRAMSHSSIALCTRSPNGTLRLASVGSGGSSRRRLKITASDANFP
jgi:hypothetical protein